MSARDREPETDWPRGFEEHRRAQVRMGLRMTYAERLRWLEETMEVFRRWQGRAQTFGRPQPGE